MALLALVAPTSKGGSGGKAGTAGKGGSDVWLAWALHDAATKDFQRGYSDIAAPLYAWDAGTEANQSGAAGPEQIGRQAAPNTGANEGGGTVRNVDGSVWPFPAGHEIVNVTITPVE